MQYFSKRSNQGMIFTCTVSGPIKVWCSPVEILIVRVQPWNRSLVNYAEYERRQKQRQHCSLFHKFFHTGVCSCMFSMIMVTWIPNTKRFVIHRVGYYELCNLHIYSLCRRLSDCKHLWNYFHTSLKFAKYCFFFSSDTCQCVCSRTWSEIHKQVSCRFESDVLFVFFVLITCHEIFSMELWAETVAKMSCTVLAEVVNW